MVNFYSFNDDELAITHQSSQRGLRNSQGLAISLFAQCHCFDHPSWINKFVRELKEPHWEFLADCGIQLPRDITLRPLNKGLLDAAYSYRNPRTNTFFFNVGEMSILLEEVSFLMGMSKELGINYEGGCRTTLVEGSLQFEHALRGILQGEEDYDEATKNGELNLELLWTKCKHWSYNNDAREQTSFKRVVLLIVAGVFLFTTKRQPLVQPVLTYLMQGLTSFVGGGDFFGSPGLFQLWLEARFTGTTRLPRTKDGITKTLFRPVKKSLDDWRKYFYGIVDKDVNWSLPFVDEFLYPVHDELELILLGAETFVAYPIHRCSHMLGHFRIPVKVSFIPCIEMHDFGTTADNRCLKEVLQRWKFCSCPTALLQQSREGKAKYASWLKPKLVPDCRPTRVNK